MKLSLVYDKDDYKLSECSYSKTYQDIFKSLLKVFPNAQHINKNCSSSDIEGDVVIFFDPHSIHNIEIDGIKNHRAVKMDYFNDPHQEESFGIYPNGKKFHKLNAEARTKRSLSRGVDFIITPSVWGYNKYISPYLGREAEKMMLFFPPVPAKPDNILEINEPLENRQFNIVCNGHLWKGKAGFTPYEFRRWVVRQKSVTHIPHHVYDNRVPVREEYIVMLSMFRAGIAACDYYAVAKYFEIPLAGCVLFAQKCNDFDLLGFKHGENCIIINERNFNKISEHFIKNYQMYQYIADAGKKYVEDNWTAEKFGEFIYKNAERNMRK